jgi:SAM-dependent methyltransferase
LFSKILKKIPFSDAAYKKYISIKNYRRFSGDFQQFAQKQAQTEKRFSLTWEERFPILNERTKTSHFEPHYTYHPAWAARILASQNPKLHVDISSTINFATLVSAFVPIEYYEYRPLEISLSGLTCKSADITNLPFPDESIESLSCMHVVEHIGLGRYGDELDYNGDLKAMFQLKRVLKKGGNLLFVVPVGKPRICFNAHRIYGYSQIMDYFSGLKLKQFALVDDRRNFIIDAESTYASQQNYGCGCWWFTKE